MKQITINLYQDAFIIDRKSRCVTKSKRRGRAYVTAAAAATMEQDKREKTPKIVLK